MECQPHLGPLSKIHQGYWEAFHWLHSALDQALPKCKTGLKCLACERVSVANRNCPNPWHWGEHWTSQPRGQNVKITQRDCSHHGGESAPWTRAEERQEGKDTRPVPVPSRRGGLCIAMLRLMHFRFLALLPGVPRVSSSCSYGRHSFHVGGNAIMNNFI